MRHRPSRLELSKTNRVHVSQHDAESRVATKAGPEVQTINRMVLRPGNE